MLRLHMFEVLGIDEVQELVYRALIETTAASSAELADVTGLALPEIESALEVLQARALVTMSTGHPSRFRAADPSVSIEALVLHQQQKLQEARAAASALRERYREASQRGKLTDLFEIVRGREAVAERFAQLQRSATQEVLTFVKPPFVDPTNETEIEALQKGVSYRSVYDRASLDYPGMLELVTRLQNAGERARTVPDLPLKAAVVDARIALIPLSLDQPGMEEGGLVVHSSSALEAFVTLFDLLWEKGAPIGLHLASSSTREELAPELLEILALMVAGLKDAAIARQLKLSKSTIDRRTRVISELLGASTRFQAGYLAAARGWTAD